MSVEWHPIEKCPRDYAVHVKLANGRVFPARWAAGRVYPRFYDIHRDVLVPLTEAIAFCITDQDIAFENQFTSNPRPVPVIG